MAQSMNDILHPGGSVDPEFPHGPEGWNRQNAESVAGDEALNLTDDHWEAIRALQDYFEHHAGEAMNMRQLHDALDERFHNKGGMKYLYQLFPGGPVSQGCRLAGLEPPAGSSNDSFGSVQ